MRTLNSLLFAVLTSLSVATQAAPASEVSTQANVATQSTSTKINLNTANAETLRRELSGIGEAKAQAIIAHRDANGAFSSVDEVLEVNGIGKTLLDRNLDKLTIE
jgi:competence protein ComEA